MVKTDHILFIAAGAFHVSKPSDLIPEMQGRFPILHTVMERLLDELSFDAPDREQKVVTIDEAYVDRMLADIVKNDDLARYIL